MILPATPVLEVLDSPRHTETGRAQLHTNLFPSCALLARKNDDISLFDSVLMPVLSGEAETEAAAASSNKSAAEQVRTADTEADASPDRW